MVKSPGKLGASARPLERTAPQETPRVSPPEQPGSTSPQAASDRLDATAPSPGPGTKTGPTTGPERPTAEQRWNYDDLANFFATRNGQEALGAWYASMQGRENLGSFEKLVVAWLELNLDLTGDVPPESGLLRAILANLGRVRSDIEHACLPETRALLDRAAREGRSIPPIPPNIDPSLKFEDLSPDAPRVDTLISATKQDLELMEAMPAVQDFIETVGPDHFKNTHMVAKQHFFWQAGPFFYAMAETGLKRENTVLESKCRSTNLDVARGLAFGTSMPPQGSPGETLGTQWDISEQSFWDTRYIGREGGFELLKRFFESQFDLSNLPKNPKPVVVLLDEGGKFSMPLHQEPFFAPYLEALDIRIVEHTRQGRFKLQDAGIEPRVPIVAVCDCDAKIDLEPIGESVVHDFVHVMGMMAPHLDPKNDFQVGVLGIGAVGSKVVDALELRGLSASAWDGWKRLRNGDVRKVTGQGRDAEVPNNVVVAATKEDALRQSNVIISCRGRETIPPHEYKNLQPWTILVSGGSGMREFSTESWKPDAWAPNEMIPQQRGNLLYGHFRGKEICLGRKDDPNRARLIKRHADDEEPILVLQGGAPINRFGLPPEVVQLTLSLVAYGAAQAASTEKPMEPGWVELRQDYQRRAVDQTNTALRQRYNGMDLDDLDFRRIEDVVRRDANPDRADTLRSKAVAPVRQPWSVAGVLQAVERAHKRDGLGPLSTFFLQKTMVDTRSAWVQQVLGPTPLEERDKYGHTPAHFIAFLMGSSIDPTPGEGPEDQFGLTPFDYKRLAGILGKMEPSLPLEDQRLHVADRAFLQNRAVQEAAVVMGHLLDAHGPWPRQRDVGSFTQTGPLALGGLPSGADAVPLWDELIELRQRWIETPAAQVDIRQDDYASLARQGYCGVLRFSSGGAEHEIKVRTEAGFSQEERGQLERAEALRYVPIGVLSPGPRITRQADATLKALEKRADAAVVKPLEGLCALERALNDVGNTAPIVIAPVDAHADDAGYWMQAAAMESVAAIRGGERKQTSAGQRKPRALVYDGPSTAVRTETLDRDSRVNSASLKGKTVVVTGATRGIGQALVKQLVREGHQVIQTGRKISERTETHVQGAQQQSLSLGNTTDVDALKYLCGNRDVVLVNNAGFVPEGSFREYPRDADASILPEDPQVMQETMKRLRQGIRVNALAPIDLQREMGTAARSLKAVDVSSIFGAPFVMGAVGTMAPTYCVSKAVLNSLAQWMSRQEGEAAAPVVVHPGWCETATGGSKAPLSAADGARMVRVAIDAPPRDAVMYQPPEQA